MMAMAVWTLGIVEGAEWAGVNQDALYRFLIGGLILILAIPLIFLGFSWYRKRLDRSEANPDPNTMMEEFRELRAKGEMSEEEYRRVKAILGNKIRGASGQAPVAMPRFERLPEETGNEDEYEWRDVEIKPTDQPPSAP